mmetsp:Transcript_8808/g.10534  ORF Transcript_8808/g.10534 Transcript_8808/m.10534 type:complete len:152 (-) Transcript_8808:464-919(-)|eukprot:CAMPEP_0184022364 /NCGR_PEP_ID=MMETSP0954-20121128/10563_1 /TAXON_ID=627963 /ORGANISM="Aplanochytrium sp, Strain PBS07" /LENGTH=151 /DNA_ID=CAMNT_0026304727 /DNA_START=75 /DNA_END=530 /DNA_ORIENTATION=-
MNTSQHGSNNITTRVALLRQQHENTFFQEQEKEVRELDPKTVDFKKYSDLPIARVKRIMKGDEDVNMVSSEVPVILGEACKIFIHDVCKQAWFKTSLEKRKNLQRNDIKEIIETTEQFDFLVDVFDGTIEAEKLEAKQKHQLAQLDQAKKA